jgi:acetylornithine deacetylase/succinyl-diaminopimelate desuccinylase-like protein
MYSLLRSRNRDLADEVINFTRKMVATPSPSFREGEVARIVRTRMESLGYDKVVTDEFGNVVGIMFGREAEPTVLLISHMDTADVGKPELWTRSPYGAEDCDDAIFGLGASDCKSGLAAQLYAGALLKASLLPLRGNLVVACSVAEEKGGSPGVRFLMENTLPSLEIKPIFAILGDPTGLNLYRGHDGYAAFEIIVQGANEFQVNDATGAIFDMFSARPGGRGGGGEMEELRVETPRFQFMGGIRRGSFGVSRRLHKADSIEAVIEAMRHEARAAAATTAAAVAVDVALPSEEQRLYTSRTTLVEKRIDAWSTDPYHPLMKRARQALAAAGCAVATGKWRLPRLGMGTAGGVLTRQYNVPALGYGPGSEDLCHTPNEYVKKDNIPEAVYGTAVIVHSLVGIPVCGWTPDEI